MVRQVVHSNALQAIINIPKHLKNRDVELIVLPVKSYKISNNRKEAALRAKGMLKKYTNPALKNAEKEAWQSHLSEKYGNI